MSSWKRSMAALLSAVMLLSSLPGAAFATVAEEADTPLELEQTVTAETADAAQATQQDEMSPAQGTPPEAADTTQQDEASPAPETAPETADAAQAVTEEASPAEDAQITEAIPAQAREDADLFPDATLAAGDKTADAVYEIAYRFSENEDWRIVTDELNGYYIRDPGKTYAGVVVGTFDENGQYPIRVSQKLNDEGKDVTFDNLRVYVMVLDVNGNSSAYRNGTQPYFTIRNESGSISVNRGTGYKLSFYADWLEQFSYSGADANGSNSVSGIVTSDEDYYNFQISNETYDPSVFFYMRNKAHTVELTRDAGAPYVNPFPYTLTFSAPTGAEAFKFTNASKGATVDADNNQVTFDKSGESVSVNGYKFTLTDTLKGEVTFEGVGNSLAQKTLGNDDTWAKEHKDEYEKPDSKNYTLNLGENDSFPFEVKFSLRGETASKDIFKNLRNAELETVPEGSVPTSVIFSKQDASVKVGDYTFTVHDDRAGEIRFETVNPAEGVPYGAQNRPVRSVTVGADAEQAEKNPLTLAQSGGTWRESGYALADGKSYTIEMKDGDTFPLQVKFSLPRDNETELKATSRSGATVVEPEEGVTVPKNQITVEFARQDASVTIGSYTFKAHSPFVNAVRYSTAHRENGVNITRSQIVGTDTAYAQAVKEAADEDGVTPEYVLFSSNAYTIELEEGEFFPRTVTFQKWDNANGWTLPTDDDGNPLPKDDKEVEKVYQEKTFDGVSSTVTNLFGRTFSVHAYWMEEVWYQFAAKDNVNNNAWVKVGTDTERAARNAKDRADGTTTSYYELFDNAGNYAINPSNNIVFPCVITFRLRNASGAYTDTEETFARSMSTVTVRNHVFSLRAGWKGEIVYAIGGQSGTVGHDAAWAATHSGYDAVNEDGSYVISVDDATFPVKVRFHLRNSTAETEIEFKNPDDVHEYEGVNFCVRPKWLDTVKYTISKDFTLEDGTPATVSRQITIGTDAEQAKAAAENAAKVTEEQLKTNPLLNIPNYQLPAFNENGAIEIQLPNDNAFYPYGLEFEYSRVKKNDDGKLVREANPAAPEKIWFNSPEDVKTVGGYKFQLSSTRTDPNRLISAGLWVGVKFDEAGNRTAGQYVPFVQYADRNAYWNDKKAEEDYEASLQSLLPLRENRLYADLSGYFPWELENAQLVIRTPDISGKLPAKQSVAWSKTVNGISSGDYDILQNGAVLRDKSGNPMLKNYDRWYYENPADAYGGVYEMIVGQLNQINQVDIPGEDIRYIIETKTSWPDFSRDFYHLLHMKMSYADENRTGVRTDWLGTYRGDGSYEDPETHEKHEIDSINFTVIEQWQNGEALLTLWVANTESVQMDAEALKKAYPGLTPAIYEGAYLTVDALNKAGNQAVDVTSRIWGQELDTQPPNVRYKANLVANTTEGAPYLTFVWMRNGIPVDVNPFQILVNIEKETLWVYDPGDGDLEDNMPADQISIGVPHTNLHAVDGYWRFDAVKPQEEEETHAKVYEYAVPPPTRNPDFKGMGTDRFYVWALGYTRHIKAGELDSKGQEVKTPLTESEYQDYTFKSTRSDIISYVGEQFYETKEDAEKAVEDETARRVELKKEYDRTTKLYTYSYADGANYSQDERHTFFSKGEPIARFVWNTEAEQKYQVKVYAGSKPYDTIEEAQADNAQNVTALMLRGDGYGAQYTNTIYFSFFNMEGKRFECYGVRIKSEIRVDYDFLALNGDPTFVAGEKFWVSRDDFEEEMGKKQVFTFTVEEGYPADGLYSMRIHYQRDYKDLTPKEETFYIIASESDLSALTLEQARAQGKDVTAVAIQDPGYTANYSNGVHFHVYNAAGELVDHTVVITRPYQTPAKSQDTYFHITGANDERGNPYPGFAMPYTADAYYIHGYQTIFLMDIKRNADGTFARDDDGNLIYIPIEEGADFYPTFVSRRANTTVYGMLDEGGEIQKTGENRYEFRNSDPAQILNYSAAAENGRHLKNYWVTFLTQQTGKAQLFVNTANDPSHYQKELVNGVEQDKLDANGNRIIEREVFINDATGDHDIFFANIGDTRLENIKVTLSDENVIRLDDYWKLPLSGASVNRYLDAYSTVETKDYNGEAVNYGGIPNIAKIRVFAANPEQANSIDTYLTISGDYVNGGVKGNVSQTIHLVGMVGDVRIDSPEEGTLRDAVKWVPYANLIHTNNIYGGSTVSFAITSGRLPNGMELRPNGEIYGAPKEIGAFPFTVTATFAYGDVTSTDSKSYTLNVLTNEGEQGDKNVWSENDWNKENDEQYFGVEHWIPDMTITGNDAEFNHGGAYVSPASADGILEGAPETDERRSRNSDKVTAQTWTEYHDVVFSSKNYSDENRNGETDFDWFIDLWLNGERLRGVRLEKGQPFTDEMRSVYDFYYWRGSVWATVTGETVAAKTQKDGNSNNTISGEFRHNQNTNDRQDTSAANFKVKGPSVKSSGGSSGGSSSGGSSSGSTGGGSSSGSSGTSSGGSSSGSSGGGSSSSGSNAYAITVAPLSHGRVSLSRDSATSGTTITVTVTPDDGYEIDSVSAQGTANKKTVTVTHSSGNRYTFEMPSRRVTVSATFKASSFDVVAESAQNGTVTLDKSSATAGESVNGSTTPDKGYLLSAVTVRDADGNVVKSETFDNGRFTFLMPSGKATVSATFDVKRLASFTDIKGTDWFFDDAEWAYNRNILRGTTEQYWEPQSLMSSVTSIVTLERLDGVDLTPFDTGADDGIDNSQWYASAQRWARDNNILLKDRPFGERDAMTRGECAVMLVNYLRYRGMNVTPANQTAFTDAAQMTQDELNAFCLLEEAGVFRGYSDGTIRANNYLSRAHLAAVLHRLSDYIIQSETPTPET